MTAPLSITTSLRQIDSKAELLELIRRSRFPALVLGEAADAPREFFCLEVRAADQRGANIGIVSIGSGTKPSWVWKRSKLFLGFNDQVAVIASDRYVLEGETRLLSLFWEFLTAPACPHVCVLCESAIVGIADDGSVLWRADTDLIASYKVEGNRLRLEMVDALPIQLDLLSGKRLRAS